MTKRYESRGDFVVCGMVTGTHVIEDIKVPVPHQVAVRIPAALAHRSKDLWIGLQQNRLFLLKGGSGLSISPDEPPSTLPSTTSSERPSADSTQLQKELASARQENAELRKLVESQGTKLEEILQAIGRLGHTVPGVPALSRETASAAVGGDVPMFVPSEGLKPKNAETNIQVAESVEATSVADAASKLRSMRKKPSTD